MIERFIVLKFAATLSTQKAFTDSH